MNIDNIDAEYAAMTLPKTGNCFSTTKDTVIMDQAYFNALLNYSASLPTGTYIGKRWKRNADSYERSATWFMGEYYAIPEFYITTKQVCGPRSKQTVGIWWRKIVVIDKAVA